jgi:hypothetical protein
MLLKLFFTLVIATGLLLMVRSKLGLHAPPPRSNDTQKPATTGPTPRQIAYALVAVLAVTSVGASLVHWTGEREVVTVRIVNSRTGETTLYQAYRNDVETRSFKTVDGVSVTIADVDRVELLER